MEILEGGMFNVRLRRNESSRAVKEKEVTVETSIDGREKWMREERLGSLFLS